MTTSTPESPKILQDSKEEKGSEVNETLESPTSVSSDAGQQDQDEKIQPPLVDEKASSDDDDKKLDEFCEKYEISPILYKALYNGNPKDRYFILRLDRDLRNFISSETVSWRLQPLNSYYRLLVHQIASYYSMGHILLKDGASMVIFKENTSVLNKSSSFSSASPTTEADSSETTTTTTPEESNTPASPSVVPEAADTSSAGPPTTSNPKLEKMKLSDVPNDLFPDVEISNDISDDFLIRNGLYQTPSLPQQYQNYHNSHNNGHHNHHNNQYYKNGGRQNFAYQNGRGGPKYYYNNNGNGVPMNGKGNVINKPFKLIKRKDPSPGQLNNSSSMASDESSSVTSGNTTAPEEPLDASLEDERLSREELYNKTRQEIFQGEEEEEEAANNDNANNEIEKNAQTGSEADSELSVSSSNSNQSQQQYTRYNNNKHQYQRRNNNFKYNKNGNGVTAFIPSPYVPTHPSLLSQPSQFYTPYGYFPPPPLPPNFIANDNVDKDMLLLLLLLQHQKQQLLLQYQMMYTAGPVGFPPQPAYYYPIPQYNNGANRRGGYGYGKRGNYNGQSNRRYYNNATVSQNENGNSGE